MPRGFYRGLIRSYDRVATLEGMPMNCTLPICAMQRLRPSVAALVGNRHGLDAVIFGQKGLMAGPAIQGSKITR